MQKRILRSNRQGLFSSVNFVVSWLHHEPDSLFKPVWVAPDCLYGTPANGNIWDHLFEPLDSFDEGTVTQHWPHLRFTASNAAALYEQDEQWRYELNRVANRIKVRSSIQAEAAGYIDRLTGRDAVGVHVRSLAHSREIPGGRPPLDLFLTETISAGSGPIFLATEQIEIVDFFRSRLGDRLIVRDVGRSHDGWDDRSEYHLKEGCTIRDAMDVIVDMLILARGVDCFIHSVSNVATAVLYTNPGLRHRFLHNRNTGSEKKAEGLPFKSLNFDPLHNLASISLSERFVGRQLNPNAFTYQRPGDPVQDKWGSGEAQRRRADQLTMAIEDCRHRVRCDPNDSSSLLRLGELYMVAGRCFDAHGCFESLNRIKPKDPAVLRAWADVCAICEKIPEAIRAYSELIELNGSDISTSLALACVLNHVRATSQALEVLKGQSELDPGRADVLEAFAQVLCDIGAFAEAALVARHATSMQNGSSSKWNLLGVAQLGTSDTRAAEASFFQSLNLNPRSIDAHLNLATTYKLQGRIDEALTVLEFAISLYRARPTVWQPAFDRDIAELSLMLERRRSLSPQPANELEDARKLEHLSVTVLLACYGDFPKYSVRALNSIVAGLHIKRHCKVHVGLNSCCDETVQRARMLRDEGLIDLLIESPRNMNKDPMLRLLLETVQTPYILWIDDDNCFTDERWPERFSEFLRNEHPFDVAGRIARWGPARNADPGYMEFIRARPWWRGNEGQPARLRYWIPFAPGGVFLARTEFLRQHDFPDRRMIKAMDDVALGEMIQQVGGRLIALPAELLAIADTDGIRRGEDATLPDGIMR